mgnify:CR=1 FL=1
MYIFGSNTPRSGGTLISNLLSMHPDVLITKDLFHFFRHIYKKYDPLNSKNLTLLDKQTRDQLKDLYGTHSYYFQGSIIEGLPNVLCEAMLCKCVPIGRRVFGIPEAIGNTGLLFDSKESLEKITSFLRDNNNKRGLMAREQIIENYPIKRRRNAFEKACDKIDVL